MRGHGLFKIDFFLTFKKYVEFVKILFFYCTFSRRTTTIFCENLVGKLGCSLILMFGLLWCLVLPRCSFMRLNSLLLQALLQSEYEYSRSDGAELQTIRSSSVDVVCAVWSHHYTVMQVAGSKASP